MKSPNNSPLFYQRMKYNESRPCDVPGCDEFRYHMSRYCKAHMYKVNYFGHPLGVPIRLKDYRRELLLCREVIARNKRDHPGLVQACRELRGWMDINNQNPSVHEDIQRFCKASVVPTRILEDSSALTQVYYHNNGYGQHGRIIFDDQSFLQVLGYRCLALIPRKVITSPRTGTRYPKAASKIARSHLGEYLWKSYGALLKNVADTAANPEKYQKKRDEAFRRPLSL